MLLELRGVSRRFGGLQAVADLSMTVAPGTIHGLIGPNGAGKSTVFNLITGVLPARPPARSVFKGERISGLGPSEICRRGIARTFQATTAVPRVHGAPERPRRRPPGARRGLASALCWSRAYRERERRARERGPRRCSTSLGLGSRRRPPGRHAARTATRRRSRWPWRSPPAPSSCILDEPLAGLTAQEKAETTWRAPALLRAGGVTILLVEHDMRAVMGVCDTVTVLDHGVRIAEGTPREIQTIPR